MKSLGLGLGLDHAGASLVGAFVTGFVVAIPEAAVSYGGKIVSVFFLAIVAEIGRRLVNRFFKGKQS